MDEDSSVVRYNAMLIGK